ncbi:MAG TPA: hypothetical protein VF224_12275 [Aestuariivirga sp.]|jgi:uncharacterized protein YcfJ
MTRSKIFAAALVTIMASGSLATDANARPSKRWCRDYAEDMADRRTGAQQVIGGAVGGAVAGGLLGAVIGGKHAVRTGVIAGGVTGGVLGGAHANKKWEKVYWRAYNDCRSWE